MFKNRLQTVLAAMCILLVLATACLSLSLIILNPPRANFPLWLALAAIFVGQSALTLTAVTMPRPPAWLRTLVAAGACFLFGIAVWRVRETLSSSHFEGYNLLLGAMLVVQSALTLAAFAAPPRSVAVQVRL